MIDRYGKFLWLLGAIVFAGSTVFAQSHPMAGTSAGGSAVPNYNDANRGNPDDYDAQGVRDREFVKKKLEECNALMKLGELAQQNSQSEDVKQFGQKLIDDHKQLDSKLEPIAAQLKVGLPKDLSHKDKKQIEKLRGLTGTQFDDEFINALLKDHQDDLKDFQSEADKTKNLQLRDTVKDSTAMISQHLQALGTMAQAHNVAAR